MFYYLTALFCLLTTTAYTAENLSPTFDLGNINVSSENAEKYQTLNMPQDNWETITLNSNLCETLPHYVVHFPGQLENQFSPNQTNPGAGLYIYSVQREENQFSPDKTNPVAGCYSSTGNVEKIRHGQLGLRKGNFNYESLREGQTKRNFHDFKSNKTKSERKWTRNQFKLRNSSTKRTRPEK